MSFRPRVIPVDVPPRVHKTLAVPRFRKNNLITYLPAAQGQRKWSSCSGPTDWSNDATLNSPPAGLNGQNESIYDYVVPRFHARVKAGEVFSNPLFHEKVVVETKLNGSWSQAATGNPWNCSGTQRIHEARQLGFSILASIPIVSIPGYTYWPQERTLISGNEISRITDIATTECLNQRGRSDSDIWEAVAELDKTLHLLRGPLLQLSDLSQRLHRSIVTNQKSRALVKEISDNYLLYRYGISPVLKDIASILKTFERQLGKQRRTSRGKDELFIEGSDTGSILYGSSRNTWVRNTQHRVTVHASSLDEVDMSIMNNIGFSLKGLLTLPWELLTYSFVYDWLANIGSYIGASIPAIGYKPLSSAITTTEVLTTVYTVSSAQATGTAPWVYTGNMSGTIAITRITTKRTPGLGRPALRTSSSLKLDKFTRAADMIALIASRFNNISNIVGPSPVRKPTYNQRKNFSLWLNQPGVR
jgi:hypothetical protein